jgi:cytochrome c oxidase assembly protein subunit 15
MTATSNILIKETVSERAHPRGLLAVQAWLCLIALLVFAMVIVGGATRLTGSGLSITEWQPILGVVPPLSDAGWQEAFQKYQQIPEYHLVNQGMTLAEFKGIYWWEWTHRLLGRLIGFVFFLPFAYFLWRGSIPRRFIGRVALLFVLGGAQGALGWFMVKSGLVGRVDVSQYRLAAHLGLATIIGGYAFWLALSIGDARGDKQLRQGNNAIFAVAIMLVALVYAQIILGGFVAGLKAGHASNTWPLMNGEFVPPGLDVYSPWYMNIFENPLTAQFNHRLVAYALALFAGLAALSIWRKEDARHFRVSISAICAVILLQIALGVATIVYEVPLRLALAHQANAILLFALVLWHCHRAGAGLYQAAARA